MAVGVNLAAQGLLALGLAPIFQLAQLEKERCVEFVGKGIEVTEALDASIPTNEGEVQTFQRVFWQSEFEGEGYPQRERREPVTTEGTLAISEHSVLLVPPPGTAGVRIPYEVVASVELSLASVELSHVKPHSMTVKSCNGRFDIFKFWQSHENELDPEAAAVAAAQLRSRVAAFQATMQKQAESPH
jgi:hypothetical protein